MPEQARRLRLLAESYGLGETSTLFDAVLDRQEENRTDAVIRSGSPDAAVAAYGHASAEWQREQMDWLRAHAAKFRAVLDA